MPAGSIAITNVTVIDVETGRRLPQSTVVIEADRIARVGRGIRLPLGATVLDGTGRFLIPGLWDMHSHNESSGEEALPLYLANGVTGTRDMGSAADFILPLRDRIARGELLGPVIVAAGPILDAAPPNWPFRRRTATAQEAETAVADLHRRGVDFIKVHDNTPRDVFSSIAQQASRLGLPFSGHVPSSVSVEEAAASGIRSIEHLANGRVFEECSPSTGYSLNGCRPRFQALASRGVWQTPTFAFSHAVPLVLSGEALPHGDYATEALREFWRRNFQEARVTSEAIEPLRRRNTGSLPAARDMRSMGNRFLAGCDLMVPGFCLHDELEWMTRAGFTPLQALQTATINPAIFLDREATMGTIRLGNRADLVLLDADPLQDISNIRRIYAVVAGGRLLRREELERIKEQLRRP
jgi:imidazolonepropionase-like amidohydrolase